jgi:hypothetical protein
MEPLLDKTNGNNGAPARRPSVAICLPGESFSSAWVTNWTNLFMSLLASGYDPAPLFGYSSSVFVTRSSMVLELLHAPTPIDYVLWIDDDNIVLPEHFARLKKDLDEVPEADMVAGWCWTEPNLMHGMPPIMSCGRLRPDYTVLPFDASEMKKAASENRLLQVGYTGFPVVLMRYGMLAKAGTNPFVPLCGENLRWGMTGEDLAFCIHARERGGALILVDPQVKVPHLKTAPIPDPVDQFESINLAAERMVRVPRPRRRFFGNGIPLFSLCHPTLRFPDGWRKACQEWYDLADNPEDCEYILCTEQTVELQRSNVPWKHFKKISNHNRHTAVTAFNTAGAVATGKVLITLADDWFPTPHWDTELLKLLPDLSAEAAVWVSTGGDNSIMTFNIVTRAYYERYNRMFYPEYWGMYADNDFTDVARRDGVIVDAKHLMFPHRHPLYGQGTWDGAYAYHNSSESYQHGAEVYAWRKAHNFEDRVGLDYVGLRPQVKNEEHLVSAP